MKQMIAYIIVFVVVFVGIFAIKIIRKLRKEIKELSTILEDMFIPKFVDLSIVEYKEHLYDMINLHLRSPNRIFLNHIPDEKE